MSAAENKAVFLSYASQDAEAARRICDALRAAGVEVWFDQSELRGGDAWDTKIRKQIKECALFVPVISVNTQARLEGYFRLEWLLAVERSRLMAEERAFLLPIVVDETTDAAAKVPEKFREVQWTRLRNGEPLEEFCARVTALLDANAGGSPPPLHTAGRTPALPGRRRVRWLIPASIAFSLVAALAVWRPWQRPDAARLAPVSPRAPITKSEVPSSPAREWVAKARALYEPWDLATWDDFKQAEQFLQRAIALDPSDSEAWAARAILACGNVVMHGAGIAGANEARAAADRAIKLAPTSDYAQFALAYAMRLNRDTEAESFRMLRELVGRQPRDRFILRTLGAPLSRRVETADEGLALLARAAALPGGDPIADYIQGESLVRYLGREDEGLAAFDRALARAPAYAFPHTEKIVTLLNRRGDLDAAQAALARIPAALLREDRVIAVTVKVWFAANDFERALRGLAAASPYMMADDFRGPVGYLKGLAHRRAGRLIAAQTEWRLGLQEIQRRLEAEPTLPINLLWRAYLLALLGERQEAQTAFDTYQQIAAGTSGAGFISNYGILVQSILAPPEEALADLQRRISSNSPGRWHFAALILFDPGLDHLRTHPGFAALTEQARTYYAERRKNGEAKK